MEVHYIAHFTDHQYLTLVLHKRNERNRYAEFCKNCQGPFATNILDFTISIDVPNHSVRDIQTIIIRIVHWVYSTSIIEPQHEIVEHEWWMARRFLDNLSSCEYIALVATLRITRCGVSCDECRIHVRESICHTSHQTTRTIRNFVVVATVVSRR